METGVPGEHGTQAGERLCAAGHDKDFVFLSGDRRFRFLDATALAFVPWKMPRAPFSVSGRFSLTVRSVNPYNNSFELLVKDLQRWKKEGYRVVLLSASRTRGQRLANDLLQEGLNELIIPRTKSGRWLPGEILITHGSAARGYEYPLIKFVVIAESDIFGQEKKKKKRQKTL